MYEVELVDRMRGRETSVHAKIRARLWCREVVFAVPLHTALVALHDVNRRIPWKRVKEF
jgi:hypothetical protein